MWGLIEHVIDPAAVLQAAFDALSSGGILFIYTPVRCGYDEIGLSLAQVGHWTRLLDRRITKAHLNLFSAEGMKVCLSTIGFEIVHFRKVCEYNLPISAYLESLGVTTSLCRPISRALDCLIDRGFLPKQYARLLSQAD